MEEDKGDCTKKNDSSVYTIYKAYFDLVLAFSGIPYKYCLSYTLHLKLTVSSQKSNISKTLNLV